MNILREELVDLYTHRYNNDLGIKRYKNFDKSKVVSVFDNLKDKYVGYLYELIYNNFFRFAVDYKYGHCDCYYDDEVDNWIVYCYAKLNDDEGSTLFHEIGHAVDHVNYCSTGCYPSSYSCKLIPTVKTLDEVIRDELKLNKDKILKTILADYKIKLDSELGEGTFDSIPHLVDLENQRKKAERKAGGLYKVISTYEERFSDNLSPELKEYWAIDQQCLDEGVTITLNRVKESKAILYMYGHYGIVLDCLGAVVDLTEPYKLNMHSKNYYKKSELLLAMEFFASMFEQEVTIRHTDKQQAVKDLLPKSYEHFYNLLDRIISSGVRHRNQNNEKLGFKYT